MVNNNANGNNGNNNGTAPTPEMGLFAPLYVMLTAPLQIINTLMVGGTGRGKRERFATRLGISEDEYQERIASQEAATTRAGFASAPVVAGRSTLFF